MLWVFWISVGFLAYTLVGYPALVFLAARLRNRGHRRAPIVPSVTVIVVAHNQPEETRAKIENTLRLEYPADRLQIIVASDASTDTTPDVIRQYASRGVTLIEVLERRGKHFAQARAIAASRGEVLVFTDVAIQLDPDALHTIVSNFADPGVGCVSSEDRVVEAGKEPEGAYIGAEMLLRRMEARVSSLLGVSGSFFAVRRELCAGWHTDQSSDFFIALHTVARGYKAVVDTQSIGTYGVTKSGRAEFERKVRTVVHGLDVFFAHLHMLNPAAFGLYAWQLLSHKFFRWLVPFAAMAMLVSSWALWDEGTFYGIVFLAQAVVYGGGALGLALPPLLRWSAFRTCSFFLLSNLAMLLAWMRFLSGERYVVWQPTKRS